jgi:survival of motor neuron-related-splicing factor 30
MADEIASFEAEIREYKLQLETIQLGLQNDPDNAELLSLKAEIDEAITLLESAIAELRPAPKPTQAGPSSPKEKWSKENHPAYQAGYRREPEPEETAPVSFAVNDTVSARWKSGDGGFYTARITSITGSKNDPVYIVKFPKYNTVETLKSRDIKPLSVEARKRKADGISGSSTPVSTPQQANPSVISAAASVDPSLAQQVRKEPSKVSDGPVRPAKIPRKVKANKELEAGKGKWQDFVTKGKGGKMAKKDSMFRTGESFTARGIYVPACFFMQLLIIPSWLHGLRQ